MGSVFGLFSKGFSALMSMDIVSASYLRLELKDGTTMQGGQRQLWGVRDEGHFLGGSGRPYALPPHRSVPHTQVASGHRRGGVCFASRLSVISDLGVLGASECARGSLLRMLLPSVIHSGLVTPRPQVCGGCSRYRNELRF